MPGFSCKIFMDSISSPRTAHKQDNGYSTPESPTAETGRGGGGGGGKVDRMPIRRSGATMIRGGRENAVPARQNGKTGAVAANWFSNIGRGGGPEAAPAAVRRNFNGAPALPVRSGLATGCRGRPSREYLPASNQDNRDDATNSHTATGGREGRRLRAGPPAFRRRMRLPGFRHFGGGAPAPGGGKSPTEHADDDNKGEGVEDKSAPAHGQIEGRRLPSIWRRPWADAHGLCKSLLLSASCGHRGRCRKINLTGISTRRYYGLFAALPVRAGDLQPRPG